MNIDEEPEILESSETIGDEEKIEQNSHTDAENQEKSEEIIEKIVDSEQKDQA